MIAREALFLLAVVAGFASAISAYLVAFHGAVTVKEVLSTTFAATIGVYVGRVLQKRIGNG